MTRIHIGCRVQFSGEQREKIEKSLTDAGADVRAVRALRGKIESLALEHSLLSRLRYAPALERRPSLWQLRQDIAAIDAALGVAARHGGHGAWRTLRAVQEQAQRELKEAVATPPKRLRRFIGRHVYTDYGSHWRSCGG